MSLSSNYLDAFTEVARLKSFSLAAKKLHITQSALSQRVLNLEHEIGSTLFIRDSSGVRLTELGQRLLRYCHSKELLESEFLSSMTSTNAKQLSGLVRVGGFSTVTRSVIVPILADLVKSHPDVNIEVQEEQLGALPELLFSGAVDFAFLTAPIEKQGVESLHIGFEENVLVRSTARHARKDIFLDHDENDTTTHDFFKVQGRKIPYYRRNFTHGIYSIIDGVKLGLGQAVLPLHLAEEAKGLEVVDGHKSLKIPIHLCYYGQAFYTKLQQTLIEKFRVEVPEYLGQRVK